MVVPSREKAALKEPSMAKLMASVACGPLTEGKEVVVEVNRPIIPPLISVTPT
jgi:hypothetical protein